jgi:hypothetical protein
MALTPAPAATVFGEGNNSCAKAFSAARHNLTFNWILGFWSGLNAARNTSAGNNTDAEGLVGEVKIVCDRNPSQTLAVAIYDVHQKLLRR